MRTPDEADISFSPNGYVRRLVPPWSTETHETLNPDDLFRTSGEALQKTNQLKRDVSAFIPQILAREPTPELAAFGHEVRQALQEVDHLLQYLTTARGKYVLLECCWRCDGDEVQCRGVTPASRNLSLPIEDSSKEELQF